MRANRLRWGMAFAVMVVIGVAAWLLRPRDEVPAPRQASAPTATAAKPTKPVRWEQVQDGKTVRFEEHVYDPPLVLDPETTAHDTPEHSAAAMLHAMRSGNWRAWQAEWDAAGQSRNLRSELEDHLTPAEHIRKLKANADDVKVSLVRRDDVIEPTGGYVVLIRRVEPPNEPSADIPAVYKRVGDRWLATQDLASSPLFDLNRPEERTAYATMRKSE